MRVGLIALPLLAATMAMAALAAPLDAEHSALAGFVGHWSVRQTLWTTPTGPAIDQGEADFNMVLDGRHLRQTLRIAAKDKPFEGLGYIGYDSAAKSWFTTWMDVNFTGFIAAKGDYDAAARTYTFKGAVPDATHPGTLIPLREVMHVIDADHFTYDYYEAPESKERLAVRLEYSRVQRRPPAT